MTIPPSAPPVLAEEPEQQSTDLGWTTKGQKQEPEPSRDATVCQSSSLHGEIPMSETTLRDVVTRAISRLERISWTVRTEAERRAQMAEVIADLRKGLAADFPTYGQGGGGSSGF